MVHAVVHAVGVRVVVALVACVYHLSLFDLSLPFPDLSPSNARERERERETQRERQREIVACTHVVLSGEENDGRVDEAFLKSVLTSNLYSRIPLVIGTDCALP